MKMSINTLHEKAEQQYDKVSQEIFDVLSSTDIDNLPELKNIIDKTELGLKQVLGDDTLIVSDKTKTLVESIKTRVSEGKNKKIPIIEELEGKLKTANTEKTKYEHLRLGQDDKGNPLKDLKNSKYLIEEAQRKYEKYDTIEEKYKETKDNINKNINSRKKEYSDLWDCIKKFPNPDEKVKDFTGTNKLDLNSLPSGKNIKALSGGALGAGFSQATKLLNIDSTEAKQLKLDQYKIKLKNKHGEFQEYIFDKMELDQTSTGSRIKLKFNTGFKIYKSDGKTIADNLNLDDIEFGFETAISHKDLKQKVAQRKTLKLALKLPVSDKTTHINAMQVEIENNLEAIYHSNFKSIKKEAISDILKSRGLNEFEALSEDEKNECTKLLGITILESEITDFEEFRDFMERKTDDMSHRYSKADYRSYLASNIQKNIKDYMKDKVKNTVMLNEPDHKAKVIAFLGKLEKSKTDNPDERINARTFMNGHINTIVSEMKKKNYMRFYSNEEHSINGQKVNINGAEGKTFDYDMNLKVLSPTSFMLELTIDGVKKTYASDSHYSLVEQVLGNYEIQSDKARLHIAYNIYKSMLGIAQKRGLKLTRKKGDDHRRTLLLENGNIKATNWKLRNNRTSDYKNLFDEKEFQASSNMEDYRKGLQDLAIEFHTLNQAEYKQHHKATKWKWLLNRHRFAAKKLPGRWYFSPIKFLLNKNRNLNFDFDTNLTIPSVGEGSEEKNISIKFEKNKFTLSDGEKTFSGFDLRKILRKPQFIDSDRKIYAEVYKNLVTKLRTNTTIKNRNYYAFDEVTQRTYIINSNGQVGYVPKEDKTIGKENIFGKNKSRGVINGQIHTMRVLDNPDDLYQDPYLMNKIIKSMNRSLRTGAAKDIIPDWMKSQKLRR